MKINFQNNGTLEDHFLRVVEANKEYERQNAWLRFSYDAYKDKYKRDISSLKKKLRTAHRLNFKLKNSIHKAYLKYVKPEKAREFFESLNIHGVASYFIKTVK